MAVWFIVLNATFNNISAISWLFGLLCLKSLSTIFQLYHCGLVYYVWNHFQQYFKLYHGGLVIMFETTFNNISAISWAVWFIMFETTFNNISAISWRLGLLCLKPLSTIFQLYHGSVVYYVWNHFQQYFSYNHGRLVYYVWNHFQQIFQLYHRQFGLLCLKSLQHYVSYIMAVWFIMFETTFNNISAISRQFGLLCLKSLSTIFQLYHGGFGLLCLKPLSTIFQLYHGGQFYWWRKPGYPDKNNWPVARHWHTVSHNVISSTLRHGRVQTHNFKSDGHWLHR